VASFEFDMSEFETMLSKLADPEPIARKMIEAATPGVKAALEANAPVDAGDLKKSIRAGSILKRNDGLFRAVRPTGVDKKGVRNMDKAAYHNYGTSKQKGSGFIEASASAAKPGALQIMQEVFDKEVGAD